MPIVQSINEDLGIVFSSFLGAISESDLLLSYEQLVESEKWKPGLHEIVDAREAYPNGITLNGLYNLSLFIKRHTARKCEGYKVAIITSDTTNSGLAHVYQEFSSGLSSNVKIFKNPSKALEWIGVMHSH